MNIVAFSGSLRKKSYNTALLRAAKELAPDDMTIDIISIDGLPVYNQDIEEAEYPKLAKELKGKVLAAEGILIATPEFNRTPPGPLKNFLDWMSKPDSEPIPFKGKPIAVTGVSSGVRGASFAQYDVRRIMGYFNARVMGQPEVYVGPATQRFDTDLNLTDEKTREVLKKFLASFKDFIASQK